CTTCFYGLQFAHDISKLRPQVLHAPFVVEEAAPAEHTFAKRLAIESQCRAQRRQLFIDFGRQQRRNEFRGGRLLAAQSRQLDQRANVRRDVFIHPALVGLADREIAVRNIVVMDTQMFPQQERIERWHRVDELQHVEIAIHRAFAIIADLLHGFLKAALLEEERTPAQPQIVQIERYDYLGRYRTWRQEQISLVGPHAMLEQDRRV